MDGDMAAKDTQEAAADDWNYRGGLFLAPMVRINHLPFRMLAAEYGADMVYSEEVRRAARHVCVPVPPRRERPLSLLLAHLLVTASRQ
eukprot:3427776-Prymnesium_polylepis.1